METQALIPLLTKGFFHFNKRIWDFPLEKIVRSNAFLNLAHFFCLFSKELPSFASIRSTVRKLVKFIEQKDVNLKRLTSRVNCILERNSKKTNSPGIHFESKIRNLKLPIFDSILRTENNIVNINAKKFLIPILVGLFCFCAIRPILNSHSFEWRRNHRNPISIGICTNRTILNSHSPEWYIKLKTFM